MSEVLREFRRGPAKAKASRCEPCLPSLTRKPPSGPGWLHEIKHDGFSMMVERTAAGVRIITRNSYNWSARYPRIVAAGHYYYEAVVTIVGDHHAQKDFYQLST